ncbi:hypothetical protein FB451DRAFT_1055265 [Mycena latifolia]|nr:hypothetical protein FB451DRAFT_1055265 [Mycena latifolia]
MRSPCSFRTLFYFQTDPTHPSFVYAKPDPSEEIVSITSLEFARATHRAAQVLRPNRVAILVLADTLLYQALIIGLMAANLVHFPISPRKSPAAVASLLRKSSCHRIIATCTTLKLLLAGVQ